MLVAALALAAAAVSVAEVPNPRTSGGWVTDQAKLISGADRESIDGRLEGLYRDLGVEMAVVTVSDVDTTPKEFATALFKKWGIGRKGADNGLLVLLVRDRRRLEMETGYGLEPILPDGYLGTMQNQVMVPRFKAGDFGGGLVAGLEAIDGRLRENAGEAREGSRRQGDPSGAGDTWMLWLTGAAALGTGSFMLWRWRANRCPKCGASLKLLDEEADDAYLEKGQRREERLGSVDYKVRICTRCDYQHIGRHAKWASEYALCPKCAFKTVRQRSETLVEATYDRTGQIKVVATCRNCDHRAERIDLLPMLEHPVVILGGGSGAGWTSSDTSSWGDSGGGGDFGGGESGGGGAGSDW